MHAYYVSHAKTKGANPFSIFEGLTRLDQEMLAHTLKHLSYQEFLASAYWFSVSTVAKARAQMRCQICNSADSISVHHRTYDNHGYEHLHMSDLVVLCSNCHGLFHGSIAQPMTRITYSKRKRPAHRWVKPHEPVYIPDDDVFLLSRELIDACRANGAFTNATLRALRMTRAKMTNGWVSRLIGTTISREQYQQAVEGKYIYRDQPIE